VGTLYNYFSDKENLLKSLLETRRLEMHASLDRELEPVAAESFATKLRTVLRYAFNDEPMRVRFRNLMRVSFDELGASASDSMLTVFAQRLEPVLESGIKDGSLRECCKEMQSLILVSIIKIVMDQKTAGNVTNEQAIEIVFSSFMQGHGAK
jgi:AcrR family transcriptional regulator